MKRPMSVGRRFTPITPAKDDLKRRGLEEHLRTLLADRHKDAVATQQDRDRSLGFSLTMFEHARDHADLHRALVGGRGGAIAHGSIRKILSDLARNELAAAADKNSADIVPRELVVEFVVGAYMAVLIWWLDGGAKLPPPKQIDAMFRRLATKGITLACNNAGSQRGAPELRPEG